ncbi:glycosyltransferase family 39 protein [Paucibacter sp. APW11]|uniref:Glycosyltransferase family 39 protein n=1 Tax=Roseateles aquae TaxID=3077235 RepID=A0ABU3P5J4_9BURK|nr:glycosyltransferase family 39 protein [Paucibacter sp. APW11]MDT8997843.1 glycosyltransferase family 39 protein [Paucibacter sp. APW11]
MTDDRFTSSTSRQAASEAAGAAPWLWLLALALLLRLLTLPLMPLTDHTEARYAEIARLMLQLGNWVSPHVTPEEVFWAKPPLSTWSQAALMALFGVSEWSGRLAAWLWALMTLAGLRWMLGTAVSAVHRAAMQTALMLCPLFFLCAGAVMTDATLGATVLLVQAAWWRVLQDQGQARRRAGWVLGLAMGLALLTKGPAAAVLALLPVLMHATWRRHWPVALQVIRDPLVWLAWMLVALPWYVLAELRTPGFIEYFVLGEHVMRFLQPGWKGDRYGFAHAEPLGMIWLYALLAALPWLLAAALRLGWLRWRRGAGAAAAQWRGTLGADLACYALCIALAPLLLFSVARNIIWTYALTALPGLVLLCLGLMSERALAWRRGWGSAAALLALMAWAFVWKLPAVAERSSDKVLYEAYRSACPAQDCALSYMSKPPYSAYFYSAGRLYAGMPGTAGKPGFSVVSRPAPAATLACNKDACLVQANAAQAATPTLP